MLFAQVPTELIKLLPDGAVSVAIITVVILFLRQQDKTSIMIKEVTETFQDTIRDMQTVWAKQADDQYKQNTETRTHFQSQIQTLMDAHLRTTQEVIESLHELKGELRSGKNVGDNKTPKE